MNPLAFGIIDAHVHVTPWRMLKPAVMDTMRRTQKNFEQLVDYTDHPEKFVALLDACGVEKAGLINYVSPDLMGFTREVNEFVADYCSKFPDRLIPYGSVHPLFCTDAAAEMDAVVKRLGIRAIKIHPPHQFYQANDHTRGLEALRTIYAKAQAYGVPVIIHTGTSIFPGARNKFADPMTVDDVAVDFPELKIVLAHGGRPLYMETAFFLVRRHRNVFLEISGIPPKKLLEYFPRIEEIAEKTIFGSDWPGPGVPDMKTVIDQFVSLPLSESSRRAILRETARRVFG